MPRKIGTLWIGSHLPDFDRLCIASWRALGHEALVYAYDEVANLPPGAKLCDAEAILPRRVLFDDAPGLSSALRADVFRMAMVAVGAGVWMDSDVLLLRPAPEPEDVLIARERGGRLSNAVFWARRDFGIMDDVVEAFRARSTPPWSRTKLRWRRLRNRLSGRCDSLDDYPMHQWGRHALEHFARKHGFSARALPAEAFHHPLVYTDFPFESPDHAALRADPSVIGLHCFSRGRRRFPDRAPDSVASWALARYAEHM